MHNSFKVLGLALVLLCSGALQAVHAYQVNLTASCSDGRKLKRKNITVFLKDQNGVTRFTKTKKTNNGGRAVFSTPHPARSYPRQGITYGNVFARFEMPNETREVQYPYSVRDNIRLVDTQYFDCGPTSLGSVIEDLSALEAEEAPDPDLWD